MLAKIHSGTIVGLNGSSVEVEVDLVKRGFPSFKVVGLPDKSVQESRDRVRSAIINSKADFPDYRLTVNLAPADLPKEGSAFDLPIAIGILAASGQLPLSDEFRSSIIVGELSLKGLVRSTSGILPITLWAQKAGYKQVFIPKKNAREASVVPGIRVLPVDSLVELMYHLNGAQVISEYPDIDVTSLVQSFSQSDIQLEDIQGQEQAKRALIIAAAGGHNVFMLGPPGSGKTLLARALPSILPRLTVEEALEVTQIYSVSGNLPPGVSLITTRVFRSPHHTTSRIGLIGGGSRPQPGEISLAHRGVLFLDELPEYPRHVLESLRQPMEDGEVTISRARAQATFPSKFMLVAASNPCQCGFLGSSRQDCRCSPYQISQYQKRISGPLLDRFDIHVRVPEVETGKLFPHNTQLKERGISSQKTRDLVQEARDIQTRRFRKTPHITCNADIGPKDIQTYCAIRDDGIDIMKQAVNQLNLSARGCHKVLKIARTIADLERSDIITREAITEALCYRRRQWG